MSAESIQDLIDEGVLEMYIDLRSGVYYDRSHNGNDGAPTSIDLDYKGGTFAVSSSKITIPDDVLLKGAEGCLGFMATDFPSGIYGLQSKMDVGGTQFHWIKSGTFFVFNDGAATRTITFDPTGTRLQAVNFKTGEAPEQFSDGEKTGDYNGTVTVTDDTADLIVGNDYVDTGEFPGILEAFFYVSRKLTASEQKAVYNSLLEPDFNEESAFQEGDVHLFQTLDGGEINVERGVTEMTGKLVVAVYLSLFGGNEDDAGGDNRSKDWWGNHDETDPSLQYRSETQYILRSMPATSSNLILLEEAILRDLAWLESVDAASSVEVIVTVPTLNRVNIAGSIEAFGQRENFNFVENWESTQ